MSTRAQPQLAMRPMLPQDVPLLAEIFRASIEELTSDDYSEAQQEAWAQAADDVEAFGARLAGEPTLVATHGGSPVGFAALADNVRIDMLYVHPAAAGQGAGNMLCDACKDGSDRCWHVAAGADRVGPGRSPRLVGGPRSQMSMRRISGARTASATAWSVKGQLTSIASRACCNIRTAALSVRTRWRPRPLVR
jgi:hypothetical protein